MMPSALQVLPVWVASASRYVLCLCCTYLSESKFVKLECPGACRRDARDKELQLSLTVESRGSEMPECKVFNFLKATPSPAILMWSTPFPCPLPLTSNTGSLQILQTNFKTGNGLSVSWENHWKVCLRVRKEPEWPRRPVAGDLFGGWCIVPSAFYIG